MKQISRLSCRTVKGQERKLKFLEASLEEMGEDRRSLHNPADEGNRNPVWRCKRYYVGQYSVSLCFGCYDKENRITLSGFTRLVKEPMSY